MKKEGFCSRCGRKLKADWGFKECERCHQRTEKRFPKLRQYKARDFEIERLYSYPSWEEYRKGVRKYFKPKTKDQIQQLQEEYEFKKRQWEIENREKIEKISGLFHVHQFPIHARECIPTRIEVRRRFVDGDIEAFETETYDHLDRCDDCNAFLVAVKNGDITDLDSSQTDPEAEKKLREEGYSSLAVWEKAMNGFGKTFGFEDPVDRALRLKYPNLRDACPVCGRVLIQGKCLNCGIRPYEN